MGHIFYIMGKSSSGKDSIYKEVLSRMDQLKTITLYTTRPIREGEKEGIEYFFVDESRCKEICNSGKVIELRSYNTVHGVWKYFTVDDKQIDLKNNSYLMIGTLESFADMSNYFEKDVMVPLYIEVEDGIRLERALKREKNQSDPKYAELCRRFLADTNDFSEKNLSKNMIYKRFINKDFQECINQIILYIDERL